MGASQSHSLKSSYSYTINASDIAAYIYSLNTVFNEYNRSPLTLEECNQLNNDLHDKLYYWLYKNKDFWRNKFNHTRVLRSIHDMWALALFVEASEYSGRLVLEWKRFNASTKSYGNIMDLKNIKYTANSSNGSQYKGDIIECTEYKTLIHRVNEKTSNSTTPYQEIKDKEIWQFPHPNKKDPAYLELRRISQLVPFDKLTEPSKMQDAPFYSDNEKRYNSILSESKTRKFGGRQSHWISSKQRKLCKDGKIRTLYINPALPGETRIKRINMGTNSTRKVIYVRA